MEIINYYWDICGEFLLHHPYRTILSISYVPEIHIEGALSLATGYLVVESIFGVSCEMPSIVRELKSLRVTRRISGCTFVIVKTCHYMTRFDDHKERPALYIAMTYYNA